MKTNRSSKIAQLKKVMELRENQAVTHLANVQKLFDEHQVRASEMCQYVIEYRERYVRSLESGVRASEVKSWQRFMKPLVNAREIQDQRVVDAGTEVARARQGWLASRLKTTMTEKLRSEIAKKEARAAERKERRSMEDNASRRSTPWSTLKR